MMFDLALLCIAENKRSDPDSTSVADEFSNAGIILTICCFFLIVWIAWVCFYLHECLHMYNICRTLLSCQSKSNQLAAFYFLIML